ncbi:MAG: hypothetical protein AAGD25_37860 [Cyanobacteria bacterium P01_F01_bin.150]
MPDQAKLIKESSNKLGYKYTDLDEGNGYLIKVENKGNYVFLSSGSICSYPINSATSVGLASDKSHSARILTSMGLPCIPGNHFFVTDSHVKLRNPGHEYSDAFDYAEKLGYPIFCKPNSGSRGDFAERINSKRSLREYIETVKQKYTSILIQKFIVGKEYRLFCFDDDVIFGYKKSPNYLVGDGVCTISEQIDNYNESIQGIGISSINKRNLVDFLGERNRSLASILAKDEKLYIQGRANLSTGGEISDFSTIPNEELSKLSLSCSKVMNLRICGVDIIDVSEHNDLSKLMVLEINGNPSLSSLMESERMSIAIDIWVRLLKEIL